MRPFGGSFRATSIAAALLVFPGTILAGHGAGSHSGSHPGSHSGAHSGSRSRQGGTHPGHGGTRHGISGHRYRSHRHHRISPGPFISHTGLYSGGCSWLWSDWSCWDRPDGFVILPLEEVDGRGPEVRAAVSADEEPDEDGDTEVDVDEPSARDARSGSALVFDVSPEDAVIYVDDEFEGIAGDLNDLERGLRLPPGEHSVTVQRPGFRDSTVTVETQTGESTNVDIQLKR